METSTLSAFLQTFVQAFSWMLIHSLWLGLLLVLIAQVVLIRRANSTIRYNLLIILFGCFIAGCAISFMLEWQSATSLTTHTFVLLPDRSGSVSQFIQSSIAYFNNNSNMILLVWFVIFLFRSLHMAGVIYYVQRSKSRNVFAPSELWIQKVKYLSHKLQIDKAVQLLESGYVKVPMVIGHLKPVLLMPAGILSGLPMAQVEAVILHELAHIKRNDYLVNIIQVIIETIFFFNPGIFWLSDLIRTEREHCCDDLALEQTNNKIDFVKALVSFKEHALYGSSYAVAFPGKKDQLLHRVSRIIGNAKRTFTIADKAFLISGLLLLITIAAATLTLSQEQAIENKIAEIARRKTPTRSVQPVIDKTTHTVSINEGKDVLYQQTVYRPHVPENEQPEEENIPAPDAEIRDDIAAQMKAAMVWTKSIMQQVRSDQQEQLIKDLAQSKKDQEQAIKDIEQSKKDHEQARLDIIQAKKDIEQARLDIIQAKEDQRLAAIAVLESKKAIEMATRSAKPNLPPDHEQ